MSFCMQGNKFKTKDKTQKSARQDEIENRCLLSVFDFE